MDTKLYSNIFRDLTNKHLLESKYLNLEFLCVLEMPLFEIMPILVVFIELDLLSWLFFHEADILVQVTLYDIKISGTFCIFSIRQIPSDRYVMLAESHSFYRSCWIIIQCHKIEFWGSIRTNFNVGKMQWTAPAETKVQKDKQKENNAKRAKVEILTILASNQYVNRLLCSLKWAHFMLWWT